MGYFSTPQPGESADPGVFTLHQFIPLIGLVWVGAALIGLILIYANVHELAAPQPAADQTPVADSPATQ